MTIKTIIERFKRTKALTCTEATAKFYNAHLTSVCDYIESKGYTDFNQFLYDDLLDYVEAQQLLGVQNKTINHRVNILQQLLKMVPETERTIDNYQVINMKKLNVETNPYMPLTQEQMNIFIEYVKSIKDSYKYIKSKLMFLLCIQNGIRATELLEIKVDNIMLESNRIYLAHTKNHQVRYAYFDDYTKEIIKKVFELRQPQIYLFENQESKNRQNLASFEEIFTTASSKVGFKVSSHILRTTFATQSLRNGCNVESVRIMMGHENITTTQRYLHMSDNEIFDDNQKYNPLANYNANQN